MSEQREGERIKRGSRERSAIVQTYKRNKRRCTQRCTERSSIFSSPSPVFFYSLADRRLGGSAARLRLCYEIGLKAKCSFLSVSVARSASVSLRHSTRSQRQLRSTRAPSLAFEVQSRVTRDGRYSRRALCPVPPIFLLEREITIVPTASDGVALSPP